MAPPPANPHSPSSSRARQVVLELVAQACVRRVDLVRQEPACAVAQLPVGARQRPQRHALVDRGGEDAIDPLAEARHDDPGRGDPGAPPAARVAAFRVQEVVHGGEAFQVALVLLARAARLHGRDLRQQDPRSLPMPGEHVRHRPQQVQLVLEERELAPGHGLRQRERDPVLAVERTSIDPARSPQQTVVDRASARSAPAS
jgi:hypothetical protein